jgi:hypothetical protein
MLAKQVKLLRKPSYNIRIAPIWRSPSVLGSVVESVYINLLRNTQFTGHY